MKQQKEEEIDIEVWNFKRIIGTLFFITVLIVGGYIFFIKDNPNMSMVMGLTTQREKPKPISIKGVNLTEKLQDLKSQVNNLDVKDLAESTPQYQKLIKDLQSLQELPKNQMKETCLNVCKSF